MYKHSNTVTTLVVLICVASHVLHGAAYQNHALSKVDQWSFYYAAIRTNQSKIFHVITKDCEYYGTVGVSATFLHSTGDYSASAPDEFGRDGIERMLPDPKFIFQDLAARYSLQFSEQGKGNKKVD